MIRERPRAPYMGERGQAAGLLLTLAETGRAAPLAIPRRVEARLVPGAGEVRVAGGSPPVDAAFLEGARRALAYAWQLVRGGTELEEERRPDVDIEFTIAGPTPLAGGSATHEIALLALAALLGISLPPHFAVGHLVGRLGALDGGASADAKARGVAPLLGALGLAPPVPLLCPPREVPVAAPPGIMALRVLDPAEGLRALDPASYARVRKHHDLHRFIGRHLPQRFTSGLSLVGPFGFLVPAEAPQGDAGAMDLVVGVASLLVYRRPARPEDQADPMRAARAVLRVHAESESRGRAPHQG